MDPLTTLGLVANVIQVIDFTSSLASETYQFAKSGSEALPQNEWLQTRTQQLKGLTDGVPALASGTQAASPCEVALHQANKACQNEASKLIAVLHGLRVPARPDGTKSKRLAVKQVFRSRWRASEIEASRKRLEASEKRLNLTLVTCVRDSQADEFKDIKTILKQHGNESKAREQTLKNVEHEVNNLISRIEQSQGKNFEGLEKLLQHNGDESKLQGERLRRIEHGVEKIDDRQQSAEERKLLEYIIATLDYPDRSSREQMIDDSHWTTFNWVLKSSPFKTWLDGGDQVEFWISGHPGSGKSTLMKYFNQNLLGAESSDGKPYDESILLASHFFWIAGTREERSMLSMLRNLLLQIISNIMSVTTIPVPEILEVIQKIRNSKKPWTIEQLFEVLIFVTGNIDMQIVFMIDGLDECEERSHDDLVRILKRLASIEKIRICLSSRPWTVFEKAFGSSPAKMLLQTLTSNDMYAYACERLRSADPTLALGSSVVDNDSAGTDQTTAIMFNSDISRTEDGSGNEPQDAHVARTSANNDDTGPERRRSGEELVQKLLTKADGVFFWLTLVLDTLCARLSDGHNLEELQRFVDDFPRKLEDYFEKLVYERIAETYRKSDHSETAMALKIALLGVEADRPYNSDGERHLGGEYLSFLHFWLLRESAITGQGVTVNPQFGKEATLRTFTETELRRMAADTSRYLAGCCKDFLHISYNGDDIITQYRETAKVFFRHRVAYDFLGTKGMQRLINGNVPSQFLEDNFWQQMTATAELRLRQKPYEYIDLLFFRPAELAINEQLQYKHHIMVAYEEFFLEWLEGRLDANTAADALRCLEENPQRANSLLTALLEHGCSRSLKYLLTETTARFPVTVRNVDEFWLLDVACGVAMRPVRLDTVDVSIVRLLLNKGADPNDLNDLKASYRQSNGIESKENTTPDQRASTWHRLLVKMGNESQAPDACRVDANNGPLTQTISTQRERDLKFTLTRLMIEHGADVDTPLFRTIFYFGARPAGWFLLADGSHQDDETPIFDVLQEILTPDDFLEIKALVITGSTAQNGDILG